ncbi:hypothetical protein HELRODRAFT_168858 [Helobdella robusta]|uniref:Uncharacterized protein n=1 Tax=Helobdella robusta TaxID=6412 RepID=T1F119_HELRO|nr:hypothetical protein HELRODRAFT_168858 [Helobdella robusta]ESO08937.1 hypothetical protein HELRODRAFT_168858 [Helobdella robusta]
MPQYSSSAEQTCTKPLPYSLLQKEPDYETCEPPLDITLFEHTPLYSLLSIHTRSAMKQAFDMIKILKNFEFKKRSFVDRSTYLHHVINQAPIMFEKYSTVIDLVPIIYQLVLKGVNVNAQNVYGNTCMHLACLRPHAAELCIHLLRLGCDPCIANKKGCRIVYTHHNHVFRMVKGESSVKSGLWYSVQAENVEMTEKLLQSWCRVNITRKKPLLELADETSNEKLMKVLQKYALTNEVVCAAFACDVPLMASLAKKGAINWQQRDGAYDLPRPLTVALGELSLWSEEVISYLIEMGATSMSSFLSEKQEYEEEFEKSEFYQLVELATMESLTKASDLILEKKVNLKLKSFQEHRKHWTYFHYVVYRQTVLQRYDNELSRLFTRCMYRLALAGIDVNARAQNGDTALLIGAADKNQQTLHHLIRMGCDSTIPNRKGECVSMEKYAGRGKLVLTKKYREVDLPGLHAAVKHNNIVMAERWLNAWARVNCKVGDRKLMDVAQSRNQSAMVELLRGYQHINEFVCATLASDYQQVMNYIALGDGLRKVNAVDLYFPTGFVLNYRAEFIPRPIIVSAIVLCTPQIVEFLLKFNANLSNQYEEKPPCGPLAFWSFQNNVCNSITLVVVKYADITLRDEIGCTMLHRIVSKNRPQYKLEVVRVLLERSINIAARDEDGRTARDYTIMYPEIELAELIRQVLDDYVLELVKLDNVIELEQLVLNDYDHILDIKDSTKKKNALEIAENKQYYDMQMFLKKIDIYKKEISILQKAVIEGDTVAVSKHAMEKKCAQCTDMGGRTLLHLAVLHERLEIIKYLLDHFPGLINRTDNLGRTALHYCVCLKDRINIWPPLQDAGADPAIADANNLTVYDYVKQLKNPVPLSAKSKSRQWRNYTPSFELIELEKNLLYTNLENEKPATNKNNKRSAVFIQDIADAMELKQEYLMEMIQKPSAMTVQQQQQFSEMLSQVHSEAYDDDADDEGIEDGGG